MIVSPCDTRGNEAPRRGGAQGLVAGPGLKAGVLACARPDAQHQAAPPQSLPLVENEMKWLVS